MAGVILLVWSKIQIWMDNSLFFRLIDGILNFMKHFFSGSVIVAFLSTEIDRNRVENSFFVRLIRGMLGCLQRLRDRFCAAAFESSLFVRGVKGILPYALGLRLQDYGVAAVCGAVGYLALSRQFSTSGLVVLLLGIIMLVFRQNMRDLLNGSWIFLFLTRNLTIAWPERKRPGVLGTLLCGLLGIAVGGLSAVFPPLYVLGACGGAIGVLLVLAYPEIGILGVAGAAPFLPTMLLAAMLGFITLCFILKLLTNKKYMYVLDLTGIFLLLYIIINLFFGATSFVPSSSIKIALLTSFFMLSYFLVISLVNTKEKLNVMFFVFATSGFVTGLYGLYKKFSGSEDMTWVDKELFEGLKYRMFSTFGNPNVYGTYLLLVIPICVALVFYARHWIAKVYYAFISSVLLLCLAYTYSRGCYLAIGLSAIVVVLFMEKRLITFFSVGLLALPFVLPPSMINRIVSITNFEDSSTSYRIMIWQATLRIIKNFWYTGLGQGIDAYNAVYPLYGFNAVTAPHSHNLYLQILVEMSVFGLLVFLLVIGCFYKTLIPYFFRSGDWTEKMLLAGIMAAVIGFLFQGIFDYVFYNNRLLLIFMILLGMGTAYVQVCQMPERNRDKDVTV